MDSVFFADSESAPRLIELIRNLVRCGELTKAHDSKFRATCKNLVQRLHAFEQDEAVLARKVGGAFASPLSLAPACSCLLSLAASFV